jgi:hypothetical protein
LTRCSRTRGAICTEPGCSLEHGRGVREDPEHTNYTQWSPGTGNHCATQEVTQKRNCGVCSREFSRNINGTRPHSHTAANCTQSNACTNCNHITVDVWGHNPVSRGNSSATCLSTGLSGRTVCDWGAAWGNVCGHVTNTGTVLPKIPHDWGPWVHLTPRQQCARYCRTPGCIESEYEPSTGSVVWCNRCQIEPLSFPITPPSELHSFSLGSEMKEQRTITNVIQKRRSRNKD